MKDNKGSRHILRFARSWGALMGVWLLLTGTLDPVEVAAGVVASAIAAFSATLVQAQEIVRFHPEMAWLSRVVRIPRRLLVDNWTVLGALVSHILGRARYPARFDPCGSLQEARTRDRQPGALSWRRLCRSRPTLTLSASMRTTI